MSEIPRKELTGKKNNQEDIFISTLKKVLEGKDGSLKEIKHRGTQETIGITINFENIEGELGNIILNEIPDAQTKIREATTELSKHKDFQRLFPGEKGNMKLKTISVNPKDKSIKSVARVLENIVHPDYFETVTLTKRKQGGYVLALYRDPKDGYDFFGGAELSETNAEGERKNIYEQNRDKRYE